MAVLPSVRVYMHAKGPTRADQVHNNTSHEGHNAFHKHDLNHILYEQATVQVPAKQIFEWMPKSLQAMAESATAEPPTYSRRSPNSQMQVAPSGSGSKPVISTAWANNLRCLTLHCASQACAAEGSTNYQNMPHAYIMRKLHGCVYDMM